MTKKILIVEDEEIIRGLLQRKLSGAGYEVSAAKDGEQGLAMLREEKPNLVLLDIVMPQKDGFAVMEEMQKDKELKDIPVIVISDNLVDALNLGDQVELDKARKLGAKDWLIKTEFDFQELIEKVRKQIG